MKSNFKEKTLRGKIGFGDHTGKPVLSAIWATATWLGARGCYVLLAGQKWAPRESAELRPTGRRKQFKAWDLRSSAKLCRVFFFSFADLFLVLNSNKCIHQNVCMYV